MLRGLSIRNMLLIEALELSFGPGLNVLTGETGAGKSILLDSLGFVLGWRTRSDLVRKGAERAEVEAVFDLERDHPVRDFLDGAGFAPEDSLILRRVSAPDGRKQAWVNERRCTAETLRRIGGFLVEIHGQHDDRGLLNPRGHRSILDAFAQAGPALAEVAQSWQDLSAARSRLEAHERHLAEIARDRDYLSHAVAELDQLAPEPGEDARLDTERRRLQAAQRIREDIQRAAGALSADGAEGALLDAARWLDGVADQAEGRLDAPLAALARIEEDLALAQQGVAKCLQDLDIDPEHLEHLEERLFAIRGLARKHNVLPDDLGEFAAELGVRLAQIEDGAATSDALRAAVAKAQTRYEKAAEILSKRRRQAAQRLDRAMAAELSPLKMERARFTTEIGPASPGPEGVDSVRFLVATNPGSPAGALDKIASGGELSRFLLALKVCLSAATHRDVTMIFDEIDRGVGGATADAVGRRLAALGRGGQVLVVTHAPQVAALGDAHWRVVKSQSGAGTRTEVLPVSDNARIDEIARMLAGDSITKEARAAARVLLEGSGA